MLCFPLQSMWDLTIHPSWGPSSSMIHHPSWRSHNLAVLEVNILDDTPPLLEISQFSLLGGQHPRWYITPLGDLTIQPSWGPTSSLVHHPFWRLYTILKPKFITSRYCLIYPSWRPTSSLVYHPFWGLWYHFNSPSLSLADSVQSTPLEGQHPRWYITPFGGSDSILTTQTYH